MTKARGAGTAVYISAGTIGITDTLIASYTVGIENTGATVQEDYNLFFGVGMPLSPTVSLGPHSHTGPAGFLNPSAGNYHPWLGSAAIDTGVAADVNFDLGPRQARRALRSSGSGWGEPPARTCCAWGR